MTASGSMKMDSLQARPLDELEVITNSLGLEFMRGGSRDVDFDGQLIRLGDAHSESQYEERLAHEIGHFLVAPKSRRWKENYGHESYSLSNKTKEREELAAAVLGMAIQLSVGSIINMYEKAYLWNYWDDADSWHEFGFWIGADILLKRGWLVNGFKLNKQKLEEFY